ncbi:hypothetical protein BGZ92_008288 [Podila epicladia]|nr:hypothetical protein BGZ92_008288 [Podila epicladia]
MSSLLQLPNDLNVSSIKNLIFDLGNVLVEVDQNATAKKFQKLGATNFHVPDAVVNFQRGRLSAQDFRTAVRLSPGLHSSVTDAQIDEAWSALLINFTSGRLDLIQKLRRDSGYKLYVLSNSDSILAERLNKIISAHHNGRSLDSFFDKTTHLKPERPAYMTVIDEQHLVPNETLFMDDSIENINAAKSCGLYAVQVDIKTDLSPLSNRRAEEN